VTGFAVDPDLLAAHAVERRLAAARVAAHLAPVGPAEDSFGLVGQVFAVGVRAAAASGEAAISRATDQFRVTAEELAAAARAYRTADATAASRLAGSRYLSDTYGAQVPRNER
jgi:hypothetical protein